MRNLFVNLCCAFLLAAPVLIASNGVLAAKRVALVIGNSQYQHTSPLKNPVNDANLIASSLEEAGFEVTKILDADYKTLKRAMLKFGSDLRNKPDAGLFYYAGHGIQVRGENYLIPVNARISDENEIELEAININSFLRVMDSSSSGINIVVLDACRNNPFGRSFRSASASRGLAPVDAPKGTYIAYATAPGDVAADGQGEDNSPYSAALSQAIKVRGITIEQVFKRARKSVLDATDNKQVPWETSSITGNFFFHEKNVEVAKTTQKETAPKKAPPIVDEAQIVYNQVKDSDNIDVLEFFASQFPDSIYSKLARVKIKSLKQASLTPQKPEKKTPAKTKVANTPAESENWSPPVLDYLRKYDDFLNKNGANNLLTSKILVPSCRNCVPYIVQCIEKFSKPSDLRGKNVRVSNSTLDWAKNIGARPVLLPGGEIFTALQTGIIECAVAGGIAVN